MPNKRPLLEKLGLERVQALHQSYLESGGNLEGTAARTSNPSISSKTLRRLFLSAGLPIRAGAKREWTGG